MKWKEPIKQLQPYQPGKSIEEVKREFGIEQVIKLASNENPFGCSPKVIKYLLQQANDLAKYPDGYAYSLRSTLANYLGVNIEQLTFGNGSDEVILMISRALLRPGINTVMATPTFPQYKHNARIEGAEVREVPLVNGEHDLSSMLQAIDDQTAVVWLCSPNNPTGCYIPEKELKTFLSAVPKDVLVVLDEAYYEYVVADDYYDAISLLERYPNLLVLRTFSKIYGLASFRVGYGVGDPFVIKRLEAVREPFNTNTLGQLAAQMALEDQTFIQDCRMRNRQGLEQYYKFCQKHGLFYYPSQTNFILIDFRRDGDDVFRYLLTKGFIVRSGKALGFPTCVRITIGTYEQNVQLIEQLERFIQEQQVKGEE
ncbi:histidinol-phosphate transaminase [Aeribacillus pallidus]|uniref:histidinol-phosphate transaminase n=1 Tax=Aeribacillus pallidus TaxID=33936 RepID=UPI003D1B061E